MTFVRAQWDRTAAIGFTVLGLVVLLLGWIGVSGANAVVKQLPYIISGGIGGIIIVSVGAVLWVSADLRDEWRELRQLRLQLGELRIAGVLPTPREETPTGPLPRVEESSPQALSEVSTAPRSLLTTAASVESPAPAPSPLAATAPTTTPALSRTVARRSRSTAPAEAPAVVAAHPTRGRTATRRPSDA